jgi:ADP-ribose pyrophosphatase YjhB (NUDIX family)
MPFEGSYAWRMRQKIGHDLLLIPGAFVVLRRDDDAVLFARRADDGTWCIPAGVSEVGSSFAGTAVTELREETGVVVDPADLIPVACHSEAEHHTIHYPGGDVSHSFAMIFMATRWTGDPRPDGDETTEMHWADPANPPSPLHEPSSHALDLYRAWLREGTFQVR